MGFEITSFVGEIDKEFVCPICMMVVEKPLASPCEHIFCAKCIVGWITLESTCPVDRQVLNVTDLTATPRFYRNLWSKLQIKCQMDSLGCESVVPLERLENHVLNCNYKPDTIVVCDKGCNLTMTRLEYQKSCVTHISAHLSNKFNGEVDQLKAKVDKLTEQVKRQRDAMIRLVNRTLAPSKLSWKKMYNMNVSPVEPNVLEPLNTNRFCWAFVQFTKLDSAHPSFRIQVLNITDGEYVVIGLTQNNHFDELPGRRVGSIGYYSRGECVVNTKVIFGLEKWKDGDIVECTVGFQHPSALSAPDAIAWADVSFSINQIEIIKKKMKVPTDGFFPTIRMGSFTNSVPKVEYLSYT